MCARACMHVPRPAPFTDSVTQASTSLSITYFLAVLGLGCSAGFSLDLARGGSTVVAVLGLLIATASLVAEHRLRASVVEAPGL